MANDAIEWSEYLDGEPDYRRDDIEKKAQARGFSLDAAYVSDLLAHGGKGPQPDAFDLDGEDLPVAILLPLSRQGFADAETYTIAENIKILADWFATGEEDLSASLWPFASDSAQGLFCFAKDEAGSGVVYVDMNEVPGDEMAVRQICANYQAFLDGLSD